MKKQLEIVVNLQHDDDFTDQRLDIQLNISANMLTLQIWSNTTRKKSTDTTSAAGSRKFSEFIWVSGSPSQLELNYIGQRANVNIFNLNGNISRTKSYKNYFDIYISNPMRSKSY
ncbi:hypothetical protein V1477_006936 [Vespula maculifrons]|uniref:Uncharacterized protein n=1 Tax=Vespula maculifrons TaxID=7453 RepID=A0ABD2CHM8_VESMC